MRKQTSILKLHGSSYGLRVGERLKHPVEPQVRENVLSYLPPEALVIVTGFSGSERRMMQILKAVAMNPEISASSGLRLLWLEGPGRRSAMMKQFVSEVAKDNKEHVQFIKIADISTFLQQLFFRYSGGYQASSTQYSALPGRPAFTTEYAEESRPMRPTGGGIAENQVGDRKEKARKKKVRKEKAKKRYPVQIFKSDLECTEPGASWTGLAASIFAAEKAREFYNIIWIDMEKHHTIAGTVSEILQKASIYDPESPGFVLTTTVAEDNQDNDVGADIKDKQQKAKENKDTKMRIKKAVESIFDIFKQGRYVLVLDSLESYGRPQLQHHGIPSFQLLNDSTRNSPFCER